jgi:hypothetical protein
MSINVWVRSWDESQNWSEVESILSSKPRGLFPDLLQPYAGKRKDEEESLQ